MKIQVFCDVMLCHWGSSSQLLEQLLYLYPKMTQFKKTNPEDDGTTII